MEHVEKGHIRDLFGGGVETHGIADFSASVEELWDARTVPD